MKFKAGVPRPPNAGRRAGTPNKRTVEVRGVLEAAARAVGGEQRLIAWIKESPQNEFAFWTQMYVRLLPVRVQGSGAHGEIELSVKLDREGLARELEGRGLPLSVFGVAKPPEQEQGPTDEAPLDETRH